MSDAILFDSHEVDHLDDLAERPRRLAGTQLLWVDLHRESQVETSEVATTFDLHESTIGYLSTPHERPVFFDHGSYIHITTYAPREDEEGELHAVECVVGKNWVVTAHDQAISVLEEFDVHAMSGDGSEGDIDVLVSMRREVGKLRRALASHRSALVALTHPELVLLGNHTSGERFESLYSRYEATVQEARDAREVIVGSFDVLIARGGHKTNEIMKVLTLTSVILLPGALLAGIMGMNFDVGLFHHAAMFWVVLAIVVAVAPITLGVAKLREWI